MLDTIVGVILQKGGLGYALFLGMVVYWARDRSHMESQINERDVAIGRLQGERVADAQKQRDDSVAVNRQLIEVLTLNKDTLDDVRELLENYPDNRRSKTR